MSKKQVKNYDILYLIQQLREVENRLKSEYPDVNIEFDFEGQYYKKYDIDNFRKMKNLHALIGIFLTLVQEFRSRGYSIVDISDFENGEQNVQILKKSFSKKGE